MARIRYDLIEDSHPVDELQSQAAGLIKRVQDTRRPVVLTEQGRDTAVLVDIDSYRILLEEIDLLRDVHRGLADIRAGRVVPHEEARARLLSRYAQ
ncbi:MAG: type II toxin-antitoxin system prevent-host-death family antitoxin [Acidobacteriota bacterium]